MPASRDPHSTHHVFEHDVTVVGRFSYLHRTNNFIALHCHALPRQDRVFANPPWSRVGLRSDRQSPALQGVISWMGRSWMAMLQVPAAESQSAVTSLCWIILMYVTATAAAQAGNRVSEQAMVNTSCQRRTSQHTT